MRNFVGGTHRRGFSAAWFGALLVAASFVPGCDDAEPTSLEANVELLKDFSYDTGPLPDSGPVRVSLAIEGNAVAKVRLPVVASDASLYASGAGAVDVSGSFTLDGKLVVDLTGVPGYDGDIPGLEDISLSLEGSAAVDRLAIDKATLVTAPIAPGDLKDIPLPGGIPGQLKLRVAEGSAIDVALTGDCASMDGDAGMFRGTLVRGGQVVIGVKVEIEVPIAGTKSFDIGEITVPLPESTHDVEATHGAVAAGDAPEGAKAAPSCASDDPPTTSSAGGEGGQGGGTSDGGADATTSGGGKECDSDSDCGDLGCNAKGVCAPLFRLCVNETLRVDRLLHAGGDREFLSHGPRVEITVTPEATNIGFRATVDVTMTELAADFTTGKASRSIEGESEVGRVHEGATVYIYDDTDTTLDVVTFPGDGAIREIRCMGDNDGIDICNESDCSYCEVDLGCFLVTKE